MINRRVLRLRAAAVLVALTAAGALTGCTAQPEAAPAAGPTTRTASVQQLACPDLTEVAALTATPFSVRTAGATACSYGTGAGVAASSTVTVQRLAASDTRTAAALRYAAMQRGAATADLPALAFDAFTASTDASCTAWFPGAGGIPTSVTARQDGVAGAKECGAAGAVATLVGSGSARSGAPIVAVVSERTVLGTATSGASWPWRIGRDAGVRIDRVTGTGGLRAGSATSLTAAAAEVSTDSAAVVLVSGTAEAGASQLQLLTAATAALSAASGRAPHAKLVVVGPVASSATTFTELEQLRTDLRSAAKIAGALYVDPSAGPGAASGTSAALDSVADAITMQLHESGVARH